MPDPIPEIKIKRLRNAKNLRLRVLDNGQVVVTAPILIPQYLINNFIAEHQSWINEKVSSSVEHQETLTESRSALLFHGKEYDFRLRVSTSEKPGVELSGNQIIVTSSSEDHPTVRAILEKWYRQKAKKYFTARLPLLSDLVNKDVKNVSIRSQRTRWGSCSSRDTISLNWRLIMAPLVASDYVIYHELAHLTHLNHSKKFWSLVEDYCPNYKEAEVWLKKHHKLLNF